MACQRSLVMAMESPWVMAKGKAWTQNECQMGRRWRCLKEMVTSLAMSLAKVTLWTEMGKAPLFEKERALSMERGKALPMKQGMVM